MSKQLKVFTTYRCNLYDNLVPENESPIFVKTLWETYNKEFAEDFIKNYKVKKGFIAKIDEITEDEI